MAKWTMQQTVDGKWALVSLEDSSTPIVGLSLQQARDIKARLESIFMNLPRVNG